MFAETRFASFAFGDFRPNVSIDFRTAACVMPAAVPIFSSDAPLFRASSIRAPRVSRRVSASASSSAMRAVVSPMLTSVSRLAMPERYHGTKGAHMDLVQEPYGGNIIPAPARGWVAVRMQDGDVHVVPVADGMYHLPQQCPCYPFLDLVEQDGDTFRTIYVHNSLDNREATE